MSEPSLTDVFGAGATQDETTLTIIKASLPGLTPSANNTGESLLTGIAKCAAINLNETNRDSNLDQSVAIDLSQTPSFTNRTDANNTSSVYVRNTITIELDKPYGTTEINPNDY